MDGTGKAGVPAAICIVMAGLCGAGLAAVVYVCDDVEPNGGRINMGAHGGTAQASKSQASAR
jgi:hypothetical protein